MKTRRRCTVFWKKNRRYLVNITHTSSLNHIPFSFYCSEKSSASTLLEVTPNELSLRSILLRSAEASFERTTSQLNSVPTKPNRVLVEKMRKRMGSGECNYTRSSWLGFKTVGKLCTSDMDKTLQVPLLLQSKFEVKALDRKLHMSYLTDDPKDLKNLR